MSDPRPTLQGPLWMYEHDTGDVTGIRLSDGTTRPFLSAAQSAAVAAGGVASGYRTVLFGDSMVDTYETLVVGVSCAYNAASGDLVVTSAGHQQAVGWLLTIWNRNYGYPSPNGLFRVSVTSVQDANTFTVNIGRSRSLLPVSDANWRYRPESWRSAQAFVPWLQSASNQRFNVIYNGGAAGDRADEALSRVQADCLAYLPQVVICQMPGVNDVSPSLLLNMTWRPIKLLSMHRTAKIRFTILLRHHQKASAVSQQPYFHPALPGLRWAQTRVAMTRSEVGPKEQAVQCTPRAKV